MFWTGVDGAASVVFCDTGMQYIMNRLYTRLAVDSVTTVASPMQ